MSAVPPDYTTIVTCSLSSCSYPASELAVNERPELYYWFVDFMGTRYYPFDGPVPTTTPGTPFVCWSRTAIYSQQPAANAASGAGFHVFNTATNTYSTPTACPGEDGNELAPLVNGLLL